MNNPYGKYLGGRDPMSVLASTVDRIAELTDEVDPISLEHLMFVFDQIIQSQPFNPLQNQVRFR